MTATEESNNHITTLTKSINIQSKRLAYIGTIQVIKGYYMETDT